MKDCVGSQAVRGFAIAGALALAFGIARPAEAAHRPFASVGHVDAAFTLRIGRPSARGPEGLKPFVVPSRRPGASPAPNDADGLKFFLNPLKRRHMALETQAAPDDAELADGR